MAFKQRMRLANLKNADNVNARGIVPKVSFSMEHTHGITINDGHGCWPTFQFEESFLLTKLSHHLFQSLITDDNEKRPVGPALLACFIFVVCGSAIFEIVQTLWSRT